MPDIPQSRSRNVFVDSGVFERECIHAGVGTRDIGAPVSSCESMRAKLAPLATYRLCSRVYSCGCAAWSCRVRCRRRRTKRAKKIRSASATRPPMRPPARAPASVVDATFAEASDAEAGLVDAEAGPVDAEAGPVNAGAAVMDDEEVDGVEREVGAVLLRVCTIL